METTATQHTIHQVWKNESARIVAVLSRVVRDVSLAEDLAHDALVSALDEWPRSGVPDHPAAWLITAAKNRALNSLRRARMVQRTHERLGFEIDTHEPLEALEAAIESEMDDDVRDDMLRLVFMACHPTLPRDARVALTLRLVGGLSTEEIARAFLVTEPTMAQRIVRAKRMLTDAKVPFALPRGEALSERLASVLEVTYLIFNEGYSATSGTELIRLDLTRDAMRLGHLLATLAPEEPEVWGLLALMELQASRAAARIDANGEPILLMDQDRALWDASLLQHGLQALATAERRGSTRGTYQLQAAIAACHARARTADQTDWTAIAHLYGELARITSSPVVELNRAIAVSRAEGPAAGLAMLDALTKDPALARYHLLPSARADLLQRLGRHAEARAEFERAAALTESMRQQQRLRERAAACARMAKGERDS